MNCIDNYSIGGDYVMESFAQDGKVKYVYCDATGKPLPDQSKLPIIKQVESNKINNISSMTSDSLYNKNLERLINRMEVSTKRINAIMNNYASPKIANQITDLTKQLVILVEQIKLQKQNDIATVNSMKQNINKEGETTKILTNQVKQLTSRMDSLIKNTIPNNTNMATTLNNLTAKINNLSTQVNTISMQTSNNTPINKLVNHMDSLIKNTIPNNANMASTLNNITAKINNLSTQVNTMAKQTSNNTPTNTSAIMASKSLTNIPLNPVNNMQINPTNSDQSNLSNVLSSLSNQITNLNKTVTTIATPKSIVTTPINNIPISPSNDVKVSLSNYINRRKTSGNKKLRPVFVAGDFNINPWGSGWNANEYPDRTAKWIWYTASSNINAPDNRGSPVSFRYVYNNTTNSNIQVRLIGMIDNSADFYLNKILIAKDLKGSDFAPVVFTLIPGRNVLRFAATNSGQGSAGLLLSFISNNDTVLFNTNKNWSYYRIRKRSISGNKLLSRKRLLSSNKSKSTKRVNKIKMYRHPVHVLGNHNVNPWGSGWNANNFSDKTAKWIWYTPNANISAPDNSKLPVSFVYYHDNKTGSNMQVRLIGMVDNVAEFYLNRKLVAKDLKSNFPPVTFTLIPGKNMFKFRVSNQGAGPAGLLLSFISVVNNTVLFNTNQKWFYLSSKKRKIPVTKYCINGKDNKEMCLDINDFMFVKEYKYIRYIRIKSLSGVINLRSITISDLKGKPIDLSKNVKISLIKNPNDSQHTIKNFIINNKFTTNDHLNYVTNETVERGAYLDIDLGKSYELGKISIINRYDGYNDNLTGAQIILMNAAFNPIKIVEYGEAAEVKDFDLINNTSVASQLVTSKDNVKLYAGTDFTGKGYPMTLLPGSYDNLGAKNDRIKSIQISNATLAIRLYSEKNFKGFTKEFKTSISNLPLVWKHTLRGIKIYPVTQALLPDNVYIFPLPYSYGTHDNQFLMLPGVINAEIDIKFKIGSISVPKDYIIGLSKGPLHNIFLDSRTITNLSNIKFGDNSPLQDIKLKVYPRGEYDLIKLYTDTNRRGTHISVRPGDYNNLANFNGRIRSIELDNKNTYTVKGFENTDYTGQTYEYNITTNNNDILKESGLKFQSIKIYRYVARNTVIVYPFANHLGFVGSDKKIPEFIEYSTESTMINKPPQFLGSIRIPKNVTVQFIRDNLNSKFMTVSRKDLSKVIYGDNFSLVNASIRVHSPSVKLAKLYTEGNLGGRALELMAGDYPNLGWINDKTVSIYLDPKVVITLFEHINYGGRQVRIDSTSNNLATFGWNEGKTRKNWLRLASSVKVSLV